VSECRISDTTMPFLPACRMTQNPPGVSIRPKA
jgi:hypothetical protein